VEKNSTEATEENEASLFVAFVFFCKKIPDVIAERQRSWGLLVLSAFMIFGIVFLAVAQLGGVSKGFKLLYYEPTPAKGQTNLLKSEITGAEAQPLPTGTVLVKKVRIQDYLENGRTNLIATSPECIADYKTRVAFSTNRLEVETANGQLSIRGEGFFYQQTNFNLTLSNHVETTIHRELIQSTNAARSFLPLGKTNSLASTQPVNILAGHFSSVSNLALYSQGVLIEDGQMQMVCESLAIRRSTNGNIESIIAEQNVQMTNKADRSWAKGDRAIYSLEPGSELVVLTGQPARWGDDERQGRAGTFTFDRTANLLRAEQQPAVRLPRSALTQPDWLAGSSALTNRPGASNQFVDITAETMVLQLPATNQPARRLSARGQVVIDSPGDQKRATADAADYDERSGVLNLQGHAIWQSPQRSVRGDTLVMERSNQVFRARGHAYLKMPLASLRAPAAASNAQKAGPVETLEAFSDEFTYQPAGLRFQQNVRANYFQGEARRGWLTCGWLDVLLHSNRLESIHARERVRLEELPDATNNLRQVSQKLACEDLQLSFYTNGLVRSAVAQTRVQAEQTETRAGRPLPINTRLTAEKVFADFFSHTNQVREMVAEGNVFMAQDSKQARGEKAVYTATNNSVELSGHPTAETPLGRITRADALVWDRTHNKLRGTGPRIIGETELRLKGTNQLGHFPRKT
jgi:lipopolysaccharide export system protein LptA